MTSLHHSPMTQDEAVPCWPLWRTSLLVFALWTVALLVLFNFGSRNQAEVEGDPDSQLRLFIGIAVAAYSWAFVTLFILWFQRLVPLGTHHMVRRVGAHLLANAMVIVMLGTLHVVVSRVVDEDPSWTKSLARAREMGVMEAVWSTFNYWFILAIATAIGNARRLRARNERLVRVESQLTQARLDTLQAQLHPHFLFNTLNAISSLIRQKDGDQAVEMIARLSTLLRQMLKGGSNHRIPLSDEVDLIEQYLRIEEVRFGDRLVVEIDISPDAEQCLVPTLLLQPLVENAIRHGIEPSASHGRIGIRAAVTEAQLSITISNDGKPFSNDSQGHSDDGHGLGLANVRDRLQQLYEQHHHFSIGPGSGGGTIVRITIPIDLGLEELPTESDQ